MSGLVYVGAAHGLTMPTAVFDALFFKNAATQAIMLHWIRLTCDQTADQRLDLALCTLSGDSSVAGTAITPKPDIALNTRASGLTLLQAGFTTQGAIVDTHEADQWSMLAPYEYLPAPEDRLIIAISGRLALRCFTAPVGTIKYNIFAKWEEIG